jgi:23S rRNA (uracil1939-C5)-methyltransferase
LKSDEHKNSGCEQLRKGMQVPATIHSLAPGGQGLTRERGMPVFVDRVAPGDQVEIELFDVRKDFARGRLVRLVSGSEQRSEPPCKLFKVCGGCQWQHIGYDWQLKAKEDIVRQTIKHIGGLDPALVLPAVGAAQPLYYRNKVQFPVASPHGSFRILAGYYKQDSHELVNVKHCPIQPEALDRMLAAVKNACEKHKVTVYDEKTRRGLLRHIAARYSFDGANILVTLVVNATKPGHAGKPGAGHEPFKLPVFEAIARELMAIMPEISGVCLNFNQRAGNRIVGDVTLPLAGQPYIIERLKTDRDDLPAVLRAGLLFKLSPTSFFQVNTVQACRLMEQIIDAINLPARPFRREKPVIVDAYAGVGAIALWVSAVASKVVAVEEHAAAVADGRLNLEMNNLQNVEFIEGEVEKVLPELDQDNLAPDILIVDPPRKGLSPSALGSIVSLKPARIVYVSCNPATLARDLKLLEHNGYKTKQIQPVDMFPQTYHIESVTVLDGINEEEAREGGPGDGRN